MLNDVYIWKCLGERTNTLGHKGTTLQGGILLPQSPLLVDKKDI